jgi:hypothetical protein
MGASATPCVVVDASATQASFVGDIGSGKKLEVVVNQGSAPFNYIWYKDGNPLQTNSNKTEFKDSYLATDYGTYTCEITNGCSRKEIKFNVSAVNVGDYQDTPAGVSWSMSGITCFDVRESLISSSVYTLSITGATATDVIWQITESSGANSLLSGSVVTNSDAMLNFKSQPAVSELAPAQITVTVLITLSQGSKVNIQKVLKFQNQSCCPGYIIEGGVWTWKNAKMPNGWKMANATTYNTPTSSDLCIAPAPSGSVVKLGYNASVAACAAYGPAEENWRLPLPAELGQLQGNQKNYGLTENHYRAQQGPGGSEPGEWEFDRSYWWGRYENNAEPFRCVRTL